jgi:hypothetical protein
MGARVAVSGAFIVEALTKVINLVGALNPGNVGTYEAGNMLIAKIFGVTSTAGLTLALCRRARTVFWAGVGAVCMIVLKKAEAPRTVAANLDPLVEPSQGEEGSANTLNAGEQTIFESSQGDQMGSACPLPGRILSRGARFNAEPQHKK